jgi:hypothetical protein
VIREQIVHVMLASPLARIRFVLWFFIIGLVLSGVTAFPLLSELELLGKLVGLTPQNSPPTCCALQHWIALVREGLRETYAHYPFMAYGTDWLAFGHLIIALFFIPPLIDPVKNVANLWCGVAACAGVLPLALICGQLRGIPFHWRLIDCSFGIFGVIPLLYAIRLISRLQQIQTQSH